MNAHIHPIFTGILGQFEPIPVGKVAPAPTRIPASAPSLELLYAAQNDVGDYAVSNAPVRDRLTDEQIEAFTDAADVDAITKMREELAGVFVRAVESAGARSTPRVPTFVSYCVNDEHDTGPKRFRPVLRMQPITIVLHDLLSASSETDSILVTYTIDNDRALSARALHIVAMSRRYADANAAAMVKLGWSAAA